MRKGSYDKGMCSHPEKEKPTEDKGNVMEQGGGWSDRQNAYPTIPGLKKVGDGA